METSLGSTGVVSIDGATENKVVVFFVVFFSVIFICFCLCSFCNYVLNAFTITLYIQSGMNISCLFQV